MGIAPVRARCESQRPQPLPCFCTIAQIRAFRGKAAKYTAGSLDREPIRTMDLCRLRCNCCGLHDPTALWPGPTGASPTQFQLDGACFEATSPSFRLSVTEKPINASDAPNVLQAGFRVRILRQRQPAERQVQRQGGKCAEAGPWRTRPQTLGGQPIR